MNDLGPEARSIVEAARGADVPTREDRARIKHGVLLRVAVLGAASTAASGAAAAMSVATKITLTVLTVAALGGGSVSLWAWKGRAAAPPTAPRIHTTLPKRAAIVPEAPAVVTEARATASEPEGQPDIQLDVRRREVVRSVSRRPDMNGPPESESTKAPAPGLDSLDRELAVLRQAQEDLRAGLPAQALRRLAEYDRRFGKGALEEERRAVAAIALCQANPGPAAQAEAGRFLRTAPESPLAERVRSVCEKSADTEK
jgi:hypothetical protein